MKKYILSFVIFIQAIIFSLGVGIFSIESNLGVYASASVQETFKETSPLTLQELQKASEGQLDYWATHLESFDGRRFDIVTPARNQSSSNICWAYATVGAVESNILRKGIDDNAGITNLDLDERVLAYSRFSRDGLHDPLYLTTEDATAAQMWNSGDKGYNAYEAMTEGYTLVNQNNSLDVNDFDAINSELMQSRYYVQDYFMIARDTDSIKRAILKYGAVSFSYAAPSNSKYFSGSTTHATNHESLIVGWDDNVSKSGFSPKTPENNGAWIVKNSWGNSGYDSYNGIYCFYMSYEQYIVAPYVVNVAMREDYQNIYHYDGQILASKTSSIAEKQAAIYEAKLSSSTKKEQLTAITLFTDLSGIDVTIEIHKNLSVNPGDVNDVMNNPEQTEVVQTTIAHIDIAGFHTIDLDEPVDLVQGEYFSVVISSTDTHNQSIVVSRPERNSTNDMTYYYKDGKWESYKDDGDYVAKIRAITNVVDIGENSSNDLKYARVEMENRAVPYEKGQDLTPDIEVYFDEELLEQGVDYKLKVENNDYPGMATLTITGINNYTGSRTAYFEVAKGKYVPSRISGTIKVYDDIKMAHDLKIPKDWEWLGNDEKLEIGKKQGLFTLIYKGADKDYYQNQYSSFYIEKIEGNKPTRTDIADANMEILGSYIYTGNGIEPRVNITYVGEALKEHNDYELELQNNTDAGEATVVVKGIGNYQGQSILTFKIRKARWPEEKPKSTMIVNKNTTNSTQITLGTDWQWEKRFEITGDKTQAVAVYKGTDKKNYGNTKMLVTITRESESETKPKNISSITINLEYESIVYDGSKKEPNVIATDGDYQLVKDKDFEVAYFENTNAGKARAVISGKDKYTGTKTIYFTINRADIQGFGVSQQGWTFGQSAPEPTISGQVGAARVTYTYSDRQDGTYTENKPTKAGDYWIKAVVEQSQNYNSAEATASFTIEKADHPENMPNTEITISRKAKTLHDVDLDAEGWQWETPSTKINGESMTAMAVYSDKENYKNYTIQITLTKEPRKNVSNLSVEIETKDFVYDGTEKTPKVIAKDGDLMLVLGKDYDVEYQDNKNAGKGKAIVTFKNDYTGSTQIEFTISKAAKPKVETTLKIHNHFEDLSEVELPDNFEWVEDSLQVISETKMIAKAIYKGSDANNYETNELTFEIIIEEEQQNPPEKPESGSLIWLAIGIPVAVLILAWVGFAIARHKRNKWWKNQ